jgi:hypothetical protein
MSDNISELQSRRDRLQQEHRAILDELLELRQRAKETSLVAQSTRPPIPQTTINYWKAGIKSAQSRLEAVQREFGLVNKALRALHVRENLRKWNGNAKQQDRIRASNGTGRECTDGHADDNEKNIFLSCFHTITRDSLDPRLFAALENDARALAADYRRMNRAKHQKIL